MTVKLVIDSDGGIDDATALWFAATSPRCDLNGVTAVWGNVDANQAVNNLCAVLEAANRTDVPIARGARGPTGPAPELARPTFVHGEYGLGANRVVAERTAYTDQPASVLLMQLTAQHPSELTLVTLGPLSTVGALALDRPDWCAQIKRVVVMGGAISVAGNVLPLSEANIAHDPMAAQAVFTAPWTEPPLLVPLDVTYQAVLRDEHFNMLAARGSAATRFLDEPLRFYRHGGSRLVPGHQCPCHDLLATMAAVVPDLVSGPIVELSVDTGSSAAWGATVADLRPTVAGDLSTPMRRSASAGAVEVGLTVDLDLFYGMLDEFLAGDA